MPDGHENTVVINVVPGSIVHLPPPSQLTAGKLPVVEPGGGDLTIPPEILDVLDNAQEVVDFFEEWRPKNPQLRALIERLKSSMTAL